jgi:hypothetical protein
LPNKQTRQIHNYASSFVALFKKFDEVWNSNDHAAWAALELSLLSVTF